MAKKNTVTIKVNWDNTRAGLDRYKQYGYKDYYTKVMRGEKRLKGVVQDVSPKEFLEGQNVKAFDVSNMIRKIQGKAKISLPVMDLVHGKRVGIDVALACEELGVDKMPTLVCGKPKKTKK